MTNLAAARTNSTSGESLDALVRGLGESFAKKAAGFDETDGFVAESYEAIRASLPVNLAPDHGCHQHHALI